jgi:hypothetical protein
MDVEKNHPRPETIKRRKTTISRTFPRGGDEETRTPDILLAKQALYQLSYIPVTTSRTRYCSEIVAASLLA